MREKTFKDFGSLFKLKLKIGEIMRTIWFVYIGNYEYRDAVFDAYSEVNRYLAENKFPIRLIFHVSNEIEKAAKDVVLELKPGFTIIIETGQGKVMAYPLEGIMDILYGWLVKTRHEVSEIYETYHRKKKAKQKGEGQGENLTKETIGLESKESKIAGTEKAEIKEETENMEKNNEETEKEEMHFGYIYGDEIPDTVIGVVSLPLVTRNPYLDFYEKFLGVQKQISGLNIMVVSASPFYHENKLIFSERLFKSILHELGHAFGLNHCSENCVMNPPSTIEEWDSRIPDFCPKCFLELKRNVEWKANKRDNTSLQRGKENRESSSTDT